MEILDGIPDGYRASIQMDDDPVNPRGMSDDHIHVLTVPGSRWLDVDKDPGPWGSHWRRLLDRYHWSQALDIMTRYASVVGAYAYDHAPHDGARSLWYLTRDDADTDGWTDPAGALEAFAREYQAWCEGDVCGYVVEREVTWQRADDPTITEKRWEIVDSCWGFYGEEGRKEAEGQARASVPAEPQ